jgi:hypothetical protein
LHVVMAPVPLQALRVVLVGNQIVSRNILVSRGAPLLSSGGVEEVLFDTLHRIAYGVFVYCGVCEPGEGGTVEQVGLRLQGEGRTVILLHGYTFLRAMGLHRWLRLNTGVPPADDGQALSSFFQKPATILIDHFDFMMLDAEECDALLLFIRKLGEESDATRRFNVLLIVASREKAAQLRENGCQVIGPAI